LNDELKMTNEKLNYQLLCYSIIQGANVENIFEKMDKKS
jgi:hypothetical protein